MSGPTSQINRICSDVLYNNRHALSHTHNQQNNSTAQAGWLYCGKAGVYLRGNFSDWLDPQIDASWHKGLD